MSGWKGVDLDGTLARYDGSHNMNSIGAPVPLMVSRVRRWLARGETVKIFTARADPNLPPDVLADFKNDIEKWCLKHIGRVLPITATKDFGMSELWDDRAVQVVPNTGRRADGRSDL